MLCFAATLVWLACTTGITVDEPPHLLSAHLYWSGEDTLYPGDMPPAIKIAGGWVSHFFPLPVPRDDAKLWASRIEWDIARVMMDRFKSSSLPLCFFYSRLPLLLFPLLTCFLLWWWARQLFSPAAALLTAALFCCSPTVLGHGALFKNDLAASFGFLLFWYRAWVYWRSPSTRHALWLGAGCLAAILAKMSMLILLPLAIALLLLRQVTVSLRHPRTLLVHLACALSVLYLGAAAAWQFDLNRTRAAEIQAWKARPNVPDWIALAAQPLRLIPTPPRLREGAISLVESNADGVGVYLLGDIHPQGHPAYFLVAALTKLQESVLLLSALAAVLLALRLARRQMPGSDLLWILPPLLYFTLASLSSLQLGIRLLLPALTCFLLWCGFALDWMLRRKATTALAAALLLWSLATAAYQHPHHIAYFNAASGGSGSGIRYLSDSNLDWGQDLPALAAYLQRHPHINTRLAYFGNDNPYARIPENRIESIAPPWSQELAKGDRLIPEPGYYAISATLLTGQLFEPRFRDYYRYFRESEPAAKLGYSIFLYHVPLPAPHTTRP